MESRIVRMDKGRVRYHLPESHTPNFSTTVETIPDILFERHAEKRQSYEYLKQGLYQLTGSVTSGSWSGHVFSNHFEAARHFCTDGIDASVEDAKSEKEWKRRIVSICDIVVSRYESLMSPVLGENQLRDYAKTLPLVDGACDYDTAASDLRWGLGPDRMREIRSMLPRQQEPRTTGIRNPPLNTSVVMPFVSGAYNGISIRQVDVLVSTMHIKFLANNAMKRHIEQSADKAGVELEDGEWKSYIDHVALRLLDDSQELANFIKESRGRGEVEDTSWMWAVYDKIGHVPYDKMVASREAVESGVEMPGSWVQSWMK